MLLTGNNFSISPGFAGYRMPTSSDSPGDEAGGIPKKDNEPNSVPADNSRNDAVAKANFGAQISQNEQRQLLDLTKYFPPEEVKAEMTSLGFDEEAVTGFLENLNKLGSHEPKKVYKALEDVFQLAETYDDELEAGTTAGNILAEAFGSMSFNLDGHLPLYPYLNGIVKKFDKEQVEAIKGELNQARLVWYMASEEKEKPLELFYSHIRLYSSLMNDDSVVAGNKEELESFLEDCISCDLDMMSWEEPLFGGDSLEQRLISLAGVTKDQNLQALLANSDLTGIIQDRDSYCYLPKLSWDTVANYGLMDYFANQIDIRASAEPKVSTEELRMMNARLEFMLQLRTRLDPKGDSEKRKVWDYPIDSVLEGVDQTKNFVYVVLNPLQSVQEEHDHKLVDLDFKPKASNSLQAQLEIFRGLVGKGFKNFNIDLKEYIFTDDNEIVAPSLIDSKEGEGTFARESASGDYINKIRDQISSLVEDFFADKEQDSFLNYLQKNDYLKETQEIPFKLANFTHFVDKLNIVFDKSNVKIYTQEERKKQQQSTCIDPDQKAVYVVNKRAVNQLTMPLSKERSEDTVIVRHSPAHAPGFRNSGKDVRYLSDRNKIFNAVVPRIHNKLVDDRGFGEHQTVATKRDEELEILYNGENGAEHHQMSFIYNTLPDFLLTTVNSDSDEQDLEIVPQDNVYDDAPVDSPNLVPSTN